MDRYDAFRAWQEAEQRRIEEAKAAESSIPDQISAQIAHLLHVQEEKDLERASLAGLQAIADEYKGRVVDCPERVKEALKNAQTKRTFGALQALKREADRAMDEQDLALVLLLINE